jgi:hypothetical protein
MTLPEHALLSGERETDLREPLLPGFKLARLNDLMQRAISQMELNLSGLVILTEAATGAYATTAVLAALAGAERVYALARPSRYGAIAEVEAWTFQLASFAGVADRVTVIDELRDDVIGCANIITNSGHLRPLSAQLIDRLPGQAAIALMFEAWEFRSEDIDLEACVRRNIPIVGVNERHQAVDVFSFLGPLSIRQLHDCGLAVYRNRIALLCDNEFAGPIFRGLSVVGATVTLFSDPGELTREEWDAVVVALKPGAEPRIGAAEARHLAANIPPGATVAQFWGDMDRAALMECGISIWPQTPPKAGHMGVLLSDIGPEPIVRLQPAGLRAAEWILRGGSPSPDGFAQLVYAPERADDRSRTLPGFSTALPVGQDAASRQGG